VTFPNTQLGLKTFHKLREFRKLHETCYDAAIRLEKSKKERKYYLMDQKANSIADLAESLRIEIVRAGLQDIPAQEGDIMVRWRNILDAEYAKSWPKIVVHGHQGRADRPYVAPRVEETKQDAVAHATV
jgi:hypothetical protein